MKKKRVQVENDSTSHGHTCDGFPQLSVGGDKEGTRNDNIVPTAFFNPRQK